MEEENLKIRVEGLPLSRLFKYLPEFGTLLNKCPAFKNLVACGHLVGAVGYSQSRFLFCLLKTPTNAEDLEASAKFLVSMGYKVEIQEEG